MSQEKVTNSCVAQCFHLMFSLSAGVCVCVWVPLPGTFYSSENGNHYLDCYPLRKQNGKRGFRHSISSSMTVICRVTYEMYWASVWLKVISPPDKTTTDSSVTQTSGYIYWADGRTSASPSTCTVQTIDSIQLVSKVSSSLIRFYIKGCKWIKILQMCCYVFSAFFWTSAACRLLMKIS